jgi:NAD(P)-dependent dehydrogenase (short-subunit alcohol dehydrogenase family)
VTELRSLPQGYQAVVWGGSGGIGRAVLQELLTDSRCGDLIAVSRRPVKASGVRTLTYEPGQPDSIARAAKEATADGDVQLHFVATGTLHGDGYGPEKALRQLEPEAFLKVMQINALLPALIAQAVLPTFGPDRTLFAALSARVGSIADNRLGGWHSYRASKAALNMLLRNIAIEAARKHKEAVVVGLHPGTVDTELSEPFQGNVPEGKLFTPAYSAAHLLGVLDGLTPEHSGRVFDYAGEAVPA